MNKVFISKFAIQFLVSRIESSVEKLPTPDRHIWRNKLVSNEVRDLHVDFLRVPPSFYEAMFREGWFITFAERRMRTNSSQPFEHSVEFEFERLGAQIDPRIVNRSGLVYDAFTSLAQETPSFRTNVYQSIVPLCDPLRGTHAQEVRFVLKQQIRALLSSTAGKSALCLHVEEGKIFYLDVMGSGENYIGEKTQARAA